MIIAPNHTGTPPGGGGDNSETPEDTFDAALRQIFALGLAFVSDSQDRERFAWRTTITLTSEGSGARSESRVMAYGASEDMWNESQQSPTPQARNLVYAELVDTQRDLDAELRRRGTAIRRIQPPYQEASLLCG